MLLALAAADPAATAPPQRELPPLEWFEPSAVLLAEAAKLGMPTDALPPPNEAIAGVPPDTAVVGLIVHAEGTRTKQWLVRLVAREKTEEEQRLAAPKPERFFTRTGHEITFAGQLDAIAIQVLGPVAGEAAADGARKPKEIWSGAFASGEFLTLGIHQASVAFERILAATQKSGQPGLIGWRNSPFTAEEIVVGQAAAQASGMTPDDERALAGTTPAIVQFFNLAARTPGVRDILRDLLDLNLIKIAFTGMPDIGMELIPLAVPVDLASWKMGHLPTRIFPFVLKLDGRPKLVCVLVVVPPDPPYSVSAGIVAMAAQSFDRPQSRVIFRLIAARSPEAKQSTSAGATNGRAEITSVQHLDAAKPANLESPHRR